ncbi:unnamed protein product [Pseudo-nitzschia multistriata]|uniref:glycerophosphodiester phosphodiesterase n=1 Tax=Pseudo-nitzschia multistriata TaxID=183589 RepID=A0A448ZMT6_9STRA|nr:unnamed protein product [Pseudo-nitzschia multistriata]
MAARKRRLSGGAESNRPGAGLPRCQPFPLTVGPRAAAPAPGQRYRLHPYPQIVVAHRGASAHLPEHSLEAYRLALELGADYIEPDLVATRDGHLVAMHSLDLTQTTNVEEVFGTSRNKTRSRFKQQQQKQQQHASTGGGDSDGSHGYWVYDFTLQEIKQLRLRQRLGGGSEERSTAFDGLFEVPTLTEILQLLNDWNENVQRVWYGTLPQAEQQQQHRYPPPPRGLYAELKDFPWILQDAGINLLDRFFDHISSEQTVWEAALLRHMCDTKHLRWGEYKLPPLVLQSFEAEVLKNFTTRWEQLAGSGDVDDTDPHNTTTNDDNDDDDDKSLPVLTQKVLLDGNTTARIPLPTPPTIVLVSHDKCRDEKFWYEMGHFYRNTISGIGPDKACFFRERPHQDANDAAAPVFQYEPSVMEHAQKFNWVVHPWTERPEREFFATHPHQRRKASAAALAPFESVLDEILFLKCTVGVDGVFSESVDVAVRALGLACPTEAQGHPNAGPSCTRSNATSTDPCPSCPLGSGMLLPLGPAILFSFVLGILAALLVLRYCCGLSPSRERVPLRRRAPRIPGRRLSHLPPHTAVPAMDRDAGEQDHETDTEPAGGGVPSGNGREVL